MYAYTEMLVKICLNNYICFIWNALNVSGKNQKENAPGWPGSILEANANQQEKALAIKTTCSSTKIHFPM